MKKTALVLLALTVFGFGAAFAQSSNRGHGATVTVPGMAFIRFTMGNSNNDIGSPDGVEFAMTTATFNVGAFGPTNASFNWDDVKVFYNGSAAWQVVVSNTGSAGFEWSKIAITPTGTGVASYDLGSTTTILTDTNKTNGWRSLGIDPADYQITFDGSEDPGTYSSTVVFTLQNP